MQVRIKVCKGVREQIIANSTKTDNQIFMCINLGMQTIRPLHCPTTAFIRRCLKIHDLSAVTIRFRNGSVLLRYSSDSQKEMRQFGFLLGTSGDTELLRVVSNCFSAMLSCWSDSRIFNILKIGISHRRASYALKLPLGVEKIYISSCNRQVFIPEKPGLLYGQRLSRNISQQLLWEHFLSYNNKYSILIELPYISPSLLKVAC